MNTVSSNVFAGVNSISASIFTGICEHCIKTVYPPVLNYVVWVSSWRVTLTVAVPMSVSKRIDIRIENHDYDR